MFRTMPFHSKETALCNVNKALQNRHFFSFAEKGRHPDPHDPLVACLVVVFIQLSVLNVKVELKVAYYLIIEKNSS